MRRRSKCVTALSISVRIKVFKSFVFHFPQAIKMGPQKWFRIGNIRVISAALRLEYVNNYARLFNSVTLCIGEVSGKIIPKWRRVFAISFAEHSWILHNFNKTYWQYLRCHCICLCNVTVPKCRPLTFCCIYNFTI